MYANVVIDISHEAVDRLFQYSVPSHLISSVTIGSEVLVPFGNGNSTRKAFVLELTEVNNWPVEKIKSITEVCARTNSIEADAINLAYWIKTRYGSTLNDALRTVLPVKKKIKEQRFKNVSLCCDEARLTAYYEKCNPRVHGARLRLIEELQKVDELPMGLITSKLGVSASVVDTLARHEIVEIKEYRAYRNVKPKLSVSMGHIELTSEQKAVVEAIYADMDTGKYSGHLIHGITGSGKTLVYMELISKVISKGQQAILLIPEISLTFQTLMRFYERFGDNIAVIHSKLSEGERYDQYERVKNGQVSIVIGPRSALFMPFDKLGIIVIDEEHESSYKSEKMPKYNAIEVAEYIAMHRNATLVLGSATPAIESYYKAQNGQLRLHKLSMRNNAMLPKVHVVDMKNELKEGNKSLFSNKFRELLTERISRGEQAMLFINRRGYAGFVSCRECGYVYKCPHCDVALTEHRGRFGDDKMVCHYCGYEVPKISNCPKCGSKYFAGFKAGTEKVEQELRKLYPSIRILRMDADTTKNKDDYDNILSDFANGTADVLVGTQMIVKGHDFHNVTLVGIVAADLSLNASDYRAAERTFQLVTQAAGRAGRGTKQGEVVLQTYNPDSYSIVHAANQDYESFYKEELTYRMVADYPPVCNMMAIQMYCANEELLERYSKAAADFIRNNASSDDMLIIGPAKAMVAKIKDVYRYVIYVKHPNLNVLIDIKDLLEKKVNDAQRKGAVSLQFDFNQSGMF